MTSDKRFRVLHCGGCGKMKWQYLNQPRPLHYVCPLCLAKRAIIEHATYPEPAHDAENEG